MFIHGEKKLSTEDQARRERMLQLKRFQSQKLKQDFTDRVAGYSRPRKAVYDLVETKWYGGTMLTVILVFSLLMAFFDPLEGDERGANWLIKQSEPVFTIIFLIDVLLQLVHSGFKRFFLGKDWMWNWLDTVVVAFGIASMFLDADSSLGMLRMLRVLRPLRTLNKVQSVKHVVVALGTSIPGLANVFGLVVFVICIYALFGVKLWVGVLEGRCARPDCASFEWDLSQCNATNGCVEEGGGCVALPDAPPSSERFCNIELLTNGDTHTYEDRGGECENGEMFPSRHDTYVPDLYAAPPTGRCCAPERCFVFGNPDGGFTNFDEIHSALLTVFNTMTLEGWSGTVFALTDADGGIVVSVYFMSLMVVGGLLVTNYLLAECCIVFDMHMENLRVANEIKEEKLRVGSIGAWAKDRVTDLETKLTELSTSSTSPKANAEAADGVVPAAAEGEKPSTLTEAAARPPSAPVRLQEKARRCVEAPAVQNLLTAAIMANFLLLSMEHHEMDGAWLEIVERGNLALTIVFTLEMAVKLFAYGILGYFRDLFNAYDALIVISSLVEIAMQGGGSVSVLRTLRVFRIARSFKLIKSGSSLRFVLETALESLAAVASFAGLLVLMMYIYTLVGMNVFGGVLRSVEEPDEAPRANFDTFVLGFASVFQVATRENWTSLLFDAMSSVSPVGAVVFYISLVLLTNYILVALFMGTLLEKFQNKFIEERDRTKPKLTVHTVTMIALAKHKLMKVVHQLRAHPDRPRVTHGRSFLILHDKHCLRKSANRIVQSERFDGLVLWAILVSSLLLAFEHPNDEVGTTRFWVLKGADIALTAFFTVEMLVKMISMGVLTHRRSYLRSSWNVLDCFVVAISIANLVITEQAVESSSSLKYLRVLRAVRALKTLQHFKRWPNLQLVVSSLIFSIPSITTICGLGLFFTLIMAILFQQLFGGSLYACSDADQTVKLACVGTFSDGGDGQLLERSWDNNPRHYDNVFASLLTMMELLTIEDWNGIMHAAIDATDPHHAPVRDHQPGWAFLFMGYIVLGSFFVMNLFVGVIVTAYNDAKTEADLGLGSVNNQDQRRIKRIRDTHDTALYQYHQTRNQTSKGWRGPFIKMMYHPYFEHGVLLTIVFNVVCMCMEYGSWDSRRVDEADLGLGCSGMNVTACVRSDQCLHNPLLGSCEPNWELQDLNEVPGMTETRKAFLRYSSEVFAYIFTLEMLTKILALGIAQWWASLWNRFDCAIVVSSLVEVFMFYLDVEGVNTSMLRIFRVCRVVRFVRLSEKATGIRNLIETFLETLPYLANVAIVLMIFVWIYAVVGVSLFTNVQKQEVLGDYLNFSTFWSAVSTLLLIASGENWTDLMHDCMLNSGCGADNPGLSLVDSWGRDLSGTYTEPVDDCGHPIFAPIYFMSFMILATYVSLNIMVAVILYTFFDFEGSPELEMLDEKRVEDFMKATEKSEVDYDQNGMIEVSAVETFLNKVGAPLGIKDTLAQTKEDSFVEFMRGRVHYVDGKKKRVENTGLNDHMAEVTKTRRRLWIHGAQGVAQADELGKSDPYAIVWWNGKRLGQTEPVFDTFDPQWEDDYAVDLAPNGGTNYIRIEIYDQDNADKDDFLGQVEVMLPSGRADDAFVDRTYRLGRRKMQTMPVSMEGAPKRRFEFLSRCRRAGAEVNDTVDIGEDGVKGSLTISLKKELWVDHDGEAEIDREELLRFCIKRKYGVDVRPTDQESAESGLTGMVSTAFGAAGLGSFSPFKRSMHNLRTVVPEDGDGNALGAAGAGKTRLPPVRVATMDRNALEQVLKLTPRDEDEDEDAEGGEALSPVVEGASGTPSPPPPDSSAGSPAPRKPREPLVSPTEAADVPGSVTPTVETTNGLKLKGP